MDQLANKIKLWIKENRTQGIKFLQRLVQEKSTRGNESCGQAIIMEKCRQLGLDLDIWEIDKNKLQDHHYYCCDRDNFEGHPNVVAVLKGTGRGKSIILNGHIDVVPIGNPDLWQDEPFSGTVKEGKLFGRGATDMKGGNTSLLLAIEAIQSLGIKLNGDVIFQSVIEEESGGTGTLAATVKGYKADGAIIPEPTNMKFFPKQQGSMWFRLVIKGVSAHGGTRYEGISAIEKAMKVIQSIQELERKRNDRIEDPLYDRVPIPIPINIGKISGGEWPSSVPDKVIIEGRMGVAPEERMEDAEKEMKTCLEELAKIDPLFLGDPVEIEWFGGRWLPSSLDPNHELMTVLSNSFEQIIGKKPIIEASPWGTDGGILSTVGDIPVVVFGPGVTKAAHESNEYIVLDDVFTCAEIIALTILKWCGVKEEGE